MTAHRQIRDRILEAVLAHVPFDGWTPRALRAGLKDAGLGADVAARTFPGGIVDLVEHLSDYADRRMVARLAEADLSGLSTRERIVLAVRTRLAVLARHREAVRRAIACLALPQNAGRGLRCSWRTVDAMWHAIGDTSANFSFYTKRATLAGIYAATALYWLADESEEFAETWAFLDRRLGDAVALARLDPRLLWERCQEILGRRRRPI